jgi:hypothetical protein
VGRLLLGPRDVQMTTQIPPPDPLLLQQRIKTLELELVISRAETKSVEGLFYRVCEMLHGKREDQEAERQILEHRREEIEKAKEGARVAAAALPISGPI